MPGKRSGLAPPPESFPNRLLGDPGDLPRLAPRGWVLAALLLFTLLPRLLMAAKLQTICPDGVFYIGLVEALERGDLQKGLGSYGLNVYPLILVFLHQFGLSVELAGKWWGVCAASLVVLPLFGWMRRQFNDRVAILGCLMYAVQPKLIEWSPELVRDPTFWLFWTGTLYFSWRAATEIRWWLFLAAGTALALAVHTRFEGWFLFVPLLLWTGWRIWGFRASAALGKHPMAGKVAQSLSGITDQQPETCASIDDLSPGTDASSCFRMASPCRDHHVPRYRWRLAGGLALACLVGPALLLLVNLTWLRDYPHWELGSFSRLRWVQTWVSATIEDGRAWLGWNPALPSASSAMAPKSTPAATAGNVAQASPTPILPQTPSASTPPAPAAMVPVSANSNSLPIHWENMPMRPTKMSFTSTAWFAVHKLERGLNPIFVLLMFGGMWGWRRVWMRRDVQPLFYISLLVLAGMWIHLWVGQDSSSRYAMSISLVGMPFSALGLFALCDRLAGGMLWVRAKLTRLPPVSPAACPAHLQQVTLVNAVRRLPREAFSMLTGAWPRLSLAQGWFVGFCIGIVVLGWVDALTGSEESRRIDAQMGHWLRSHYPQQRLLVAGPIVLVGYYSELSPEYLALFDDWGDVVRRFEAANPDVVVCCSSRKPSAIVEPLLALAGQHGLVPIDPRQLPEAASREGYIVLCRPTALAGVATQKR